MTQQELAYRQYLAQQRQTVRNFVYLTAGKVKEEQQPEPKTPVSAIPIDKIKDFQEQRTEITNVYEQLGPKPKDADKMGDIANSISTYRSNASLPTTEFTTVDSVKESVEDLVEKLNA